MSDPKLNAITRILSTTTQLSAKTTFYGAALSAIYLMGSGMSPDALPPALATFAGGVGVEALGSLIDRMANGDAMDEDDMREVVLNAVGESGIKEALTRDELRRDLHEVIRKTHLDILHTTIDAKHKIVAERLLDQSEQIALLRDELPKLREQVQNITIGGNITAGIANFGGTQVFEGDVTINWGAFPDDYVVNRHFKVFLSSPGDVGMERSIVREVIDTMNQHPFMKRMQITLDLVAWDTPGQFIPFMANEIPQESVNAAMELPEECDIVIVIFWSRMGTPLTQDMTKEDGTSYLSGTEWEYHNALEGYQKSGTKPRVLVYRRTQPPSITVTDITKAQEQLAQYQKVEDFFKAFYDGDTILRGFNKYESTDQFRKDVERHLSKLLEILATEKRQKTAPTSAPAALEPTWEGSPFPGLRAFTPRDAGIFYGRGTETDQLTQLLGKQHFVAVVGASGSGKSSLVGAGLIPRLRKGETIHGSDQWNLPDYDPDTETWTGLRFTPNEQADENPFYALADQLDDLLSEKRGAIAKQLQQSPDYLSEALAAAHPNTLFLMFVDQFEEMFTVIEERYRRPFMDMLVAANDADNLRVVVTVRADFIHHFIAYGRLNTLLNEGMYTLAAPRLGALFQMITLPAQRAGLTFEDGLPEEILDDTGTEPGGLALLAYALDELYHRAENGKITSAVYKALEGVQGAIGERAEEAFKQLTGKDEEKEALLGRVFRYLVSVDERGVATRQRWTVSRDDLPDDMATLIDVFVDARLLVSSRGTLEVAHEALLRSWTRLVQWIEEAQEDLILLRQVRAGAHDWDNRGRPDTFRWNHERLVLVHAMWGRLDERAKVLLDDRDLIEAFIEPEVARLVRELEDITTTHTRRYAIGERLADIGDTRPGVGLRPDGLPDIVWCDVNVPDDASIDIEGTALPVQSFKIAKYLVTHQQFDVFLNALDGFENETWWDGMGEYIKQDMRTATHASPNAPRDSVSWYQAVAFTRWLTVKYREYGVFDELQALTPNPSPTGEGHDALTPNPSPTGEGLMDYRAMAAKVIVDVARELRQRQTPAEEILWSCLRNRQLNGLKFRRQHPVAGTAFVVDFFSYDPKLVVEVDGGIHRQQQQEDEWRQQSLEALGLRVLRVSNETVFNNLEQVLIQIQVAAESPFSTREKGPGDEGTNWEIRLPAEWEWQWAAQNGTGAREYPWGEWDEHPRANTQEAGIQNRSTAVGMYPHGEAVCGALDMAGNLWEWCLNELSNYDQIGLDDTNSNRALRGGSFNSEAGYTRCALRHDYYPYWYNNSNGFRVLLVGSPINNSVI
ncbi:MAG: DUF559 domain-containing protein [Chloroflexota bacterium]